MGTMHDAIPAMENIEISTIEPFTTDQHFINRTEAIAPLLLAYSLYACEVVDNFE